MMVLNRAGLVFIGRRTAGPNTSMLTHVWQMPQGGIDEGEDPYKAALRELYEETNIRSVQKLGEIAGWLTYDIPTRHRRHRPGAANIAGRSRSGMRCVSPEPTSEIDIAHPGGGHEPEFVEWRWVAVRELPELVVPFKRPHLRARRKGIRTVRAIALVHRRAGEVAIDFLEVVELRDQLVRPEPGSVLAMRLSSSPMRAVIMPRSTSSTASATSARTVKPVSRHFRKTAEHDDLLPAAGAIHR